MAIQGYSSFNPLVVQGAKKPDYKPRKEVSCWETPFNWIVNGLRSVEDLSKNYKKGDFGSLIMNIGKFVVCLIATVISLPTVIVPFLLIREYTIQKENEAYKSAKLRADNEIAQLEGQYAQDDADKTAALIEKVKNEYTKNTVVEQRVKTARREGIAEGAIDKITQAEHDRLLREAEARAEARGAQGKFSQAEVDERIRLAKVGLFTQEQMNNAVALATQGMYSVEQHRGRINHFINGLRVFHVNDNGGNEAAFNAKVIELENLH